MKQIVINLDDSLAEQLQNDLENLVSGMGAFKIGAQQGVTYEQFIDLAKITAEEEAKKKVERLTKVVDEMKKRDIKISDYFSALFKVYSRFSIQFEDSNIIDFKSKELFDRNVPQEEIDDNICQFRTKLLESLAAFFDPRAEKILEAQKQQQEVTQQEVAQ